MEVSDVSWLDEELITSELADFIRNFSALDGADLLGVASDVA